MSREAIPQPAVVQPSLSDHNRLRDLLALVIQGEHIDLSPNTDEGIVIQLMRVNAPYWHSLPDILTALVNENNIVADGETDQLNIGAEYEEAKGKHKEAVRATQALSTDGPEVLELKAEQTKVIASLKQLRRYMKEIQDDLDTTMEDIHALDARQTDSDVMRSYLRTAQGIKASYDSVAKNISELEETLELVEGRVEDAVERQLSHFHDVNAERTQLEEKRKVLKRSRKSLPSVIADARVRKTEIWGSVIGVITHLLALPGDFQSKCSMRQRPYEFIEKWDRELIDKYGTRGDISASIQTMTKFTNQQEERARIRDQTAELMREKRYEIIDKKIDLAKYTEQLSREIEGFILNATSGAWETKQTFDREAVAEQFRLGAAIPRSGLVHIRLHTKDPNMHEAFRAYVEDLTPIADEVKEAMIAALHEMTQLLGANLPHVPTISGVHYNAYNAESRTASRRYICVSTLTFINEIDLAIQNLTQPAATFDCYLKYGGIIEFGSDRPTIATDDHAMEYVNPFSLDAMFYFFNVAGVKHDAIEAVHIWLEIANGECEDGDCIPSALSYCQPGIIAVPSVEVAGVRDALKAGVPSATEEGLHALFKKLSMPWIVVTHISESGEWVIYAASSSELKQVTPDYFDEHRMDTVFIYVSHDHATRVIGVRPYTGAGWKYTIDGPLVLGHLRKDTGVGHSMSKLLLGNRAMFSHSVACVGPRTMQAIMSFREATCAKEILRLLATGIALEEMVIDSVNEREAYEEEHPERAPIPLGPNASREDAEDLTPITTDDMPDISIATDMAHKELNTRRICRGKENSFNVWWMMMLPVWLIIEWVSLPDGKPDHTQWHAADASDKALLSFTTEQIMRQFGHIIVLLREGSRYFRVVDFIGRCTPKPEACLEVMIRDRFAVVKPDGGLIELIRTLQPRGTPTNPDEPLISEEEYNALDLIDADSDVWQATLSKIRVAIIDRAIFEGGELHINFAVPPTKRITQRELIDGASDLLRLWREPNGEQLFIHHTTWYDARPKPGDAPKLIRFIAADYESPNDGLATIPLLHAEASVTSADLTQVTVTHHVGPSCANAYIMSLMDIDKRTEVHPITFNGSMFDHHFDLRALGEVGCLGGHFQRGKKVAKRLLDSVTSVGCRIYEMRCGNNLVFHDLRRFTGMSLKRLCKLLKVCVRKSEINLSRVQQEFEASGCSWDPFKMRMMNLPSAELINEVIEDDDEIEDDAVGKAANLAFLENVRSMNAYDAYIAYCENDVRATLECYLKIRAASLARISEYPKEQQEKLMKVLDIKNSCTGPSLAYKIFRATLPKRADGSIIEPPKAPNWQVHQFIRKTLIGGCSRVWQYTMAGIVREHYAGLDASSLFPGAAIYGHMPDGELRFVQVAAYRPGAVESREYKRWSKLTASAEAITTVPSLPIRDKLGCYFVTFQVPQGKLCRVPFRPKEGTLNWEYHGRYSRWLTSIDILDMRANGIIVDTHYGFYWTGICDSYFDGSLKVWKRLKEVQDEYKRKKDSRYDVVKRETNKNDSNQLLGKLARAIAATESVLLRGREIIMDKIDELRGKKVTFAVHELAPKPAKGYESLSSQISNQYDGSAIITYDIDQHQEFIDSPSDVSEICLSAFMLAYSRFHMNNAVIERFCQARAARGLETDGEHGNPAEYEAWFEEQCRDSSFSRKWGTNPWWVPSPLNSVRPGSPLDDATFRHCGILGAFHHPKRAAAWSKARHAEVEGLTGIEYLCFKDELPTGVYDVSHPFCKMYYAEPVEGMVDTSGERPKTVIRCKGVGIKSKIADSLIAMQQVTAYRTSDERAKGRMLTNALDSAPVAVGRSFFEKLGAGYPVDIADFRFQPHLTKVLAEYAFEQGDDETPSSEVSREHAPTGLAYTFAFKRIEPDIRLRLTIRTPQMDPCTPMKDHVAYQRNAGKGGARIPFDQRTTFSLGGMPVDINFLTAVYQQLDQHARDMNAPLGIRTVIDSQICYVSKRELAFLTFYRNDIAVAFRVTLIFHSPSQRKALRDASRAAPRVVHRAKKSVSRRRVPLQREGGEASLLSEASGGPPIEAERETQAGEGV